MKDRKLPRTAAGPGSRRPSPKRIPCTPGAPTEGLAETVVERPLARTVVERPPATTAGLARTVVVTPGPATTVKGAPLEKTERLSRARRAPAASLAKAETANLPAGALPVKKGRLAPEVQEAMADPARRIGRYALLAELGRGGMGVVHRAYDTKLRRSVALKLILDPERAGPELLERFRREAAAAARLRHPGIVAVHEVGEHEGCPFMVLELVKGQSLEAVLREGSLAPRRVAELVRDIARALEHAHENGIIHRDVKPENVLVDRDGAPHLMDFGLARDGEDLERLTASGQILGTPAYMAPEQARGDVGAQGPWTDVYGLGGMLYRALAGRPPLQARSLQALLQKIQSEEPAPLRKLRPDLAPDLDTIALRCLAKEPERRYASGAEVAAELERFLDGEAIAAKPVGRVERARVWARRNPRLSASLGALGLALAVSLGLGGVVLVRDLEARHAEEARALRARAILEDARAGRLEQPRAHEVALLELAGLKASGTAALCAEALEGVSDELERATRDFLLDAAHPDRDEEAVGEHSLVGLDAALEKRFARGGFARPLAAAEEGAIEAAGRRRVTRELRRRATQPGSTPDSGKFSLSSLLADAQAVRLGKGPGELAVLAADALGTLGLREGGAVPALARFLGVTADQNAAARAGSALVALGGPDALRPVVGARRRLGEQGAFWTTVRPLLARAGLEASWPATTASELAERAEVREAVGDHDGALADATRAQAQEPKNPAPRLARARLRRAHRDAAGALEDLTAAIELAPADARVRLERALVRLDERDWRGALEDLDRALELGSDEVTVWVERATVRRRLGQTADALADANKAVALDPRSGRALQIRGRLRFEAGDTAGALEDANQATSLDGRDAAALGLRARVLLSKGELVEALADATRAVELDPKVAERWAVRAEVRIRRGEMDLALADLDQAVVLDPETAEPWARRAVVRLARGELAPALSDISNACCLAPREAKLWHIRAGILYRQQKWDEAIHDEGEALRRDDKMAEAYDQRAAAKAQKSDWDGAIADADRAIALSDKLDTAFANRGHARRMKGDLEGALADFARAVELKPDEPENWENRGGLRLQKGDLEGALADFTRSVEVAPRFGRGWLGKGMVRMAKGDTRGALAELDKAVESAPDLFKAWVIRGQAHEKLEDHVAAIADFEKAVAIEPNHPTAPRIRALVAALRNVVQGEAKAAKKKGG